MGERTDGDEERSPDEASGDSEDVEALVREYLNRRGSGEEVDFEEYTRKLPELESELRGVLDRIGRELLVRPDAETVADGESLILGDFRILGRIGAGGMASVYEAEQVSLNRRVALKVLPSHLSFSDEAVMSFRREAEAGGRQAHPGIVSVYAAGEHEGAHYIAQELVEGGRTLAGMLEEQRARETLPTGYFREVARLVREVALALQHAHDSGVIHRDVKPSNILLTPEDRPRLTDFGLAKVEGAMALSRTGDFTGTPYYMSPEQAMSRRVPITASTDIFSLGVTCYELLTLERPFDGESSHEVLTKVVFHEPRDPRRVNPRVPRDLAIICLKAMEKRPEKRYADMASFADDLGRFLDGETILAHPVGAGARLWRRVRRNPAVSSLGGLAFLLLILVVFVLPWVVLKAERDQRLAVEAESRKSQAVIGFLQTILSSPRPGAKGREVRVVEVLERAAREIDSWEAADPEVEAVLRSTIARTYAALGHAPEALEQYRAAHERSRRAVGERDPGTIYHGQCLAIFLNQIGRPGEAETLGREVYQAQREALGADHPDTLKSLATLVDALRAQGRLPEAETLIDELLERRRRVLGGEDPKTLGTLQLFASLRLQQGRHEEAERLFRELIDSRTRVLGADHHDTILSRSHLARVLVGQRRYPEARRLYEELLETTAGPPEHDPSLLPLLRLRYGQCLLEQKDYPAAEPQLLAAHEQFRRSHGTEHRHTRSTLRQLVRLHVEQEQPEQAEEYRVLLTGSDVTGKE